MTHIEQPDMNDPGAPGAPGIPAVVAYFLASVFAAVCSYSGFKGWFLFFNSYLTSHEGEIIGAVVGLISALWLFSIFAMFGARIKFSSDEDISSIPRVNRVIFCACCIFAAACSTPVIKGFLFSVLDYIIGGMTANTSCDALPASGMHELQKIFYGFQCDISGLLCWVMAVGLALRLIDYLGGWRVLGGVQK